MLSAAATSTVFLVSYLVYHAAVGSVRFTGQGPVRIVYFTILITHTILAAVIVPMVLRTLYLGLKRRDETAPTPRALDVPALGLRLGDGSRDLRSCSTSFTIPARFG